MKCEIRKERPVGVRVDLRWSALLEQHPTVKVEDVQKLPRALHLQWPSNHHRSVLLHWNQLHGELLPSH